MSDNIDIIVQDTINDIIVNSSTIVETIDIVVEASVEEVTIISNPNDYIININRVIGEQVQSDWNETQPNDPSYIKNKPTIPDAQVNSDWNATTGVAEILNKPTIPTQVTNTSELINDGADGVNPFITAQDIPAGQVNSDWNATSGVAEILNKPTIPAEQVNSDWNATSGKAQILNKPTIPSIEGLATITYVDTQDALKVDKIAGKGLSTNDFTNTLKTKLDGIQAGAEVNVNADWNAVSGDAQILNKPTIPSIAGLATITYVDTQDALKVDKVAGKGLSTNDFTNTLKTKLDGIQDGAEVNVNADWNATTGDAQILNKPTIPSAQVNSDWNATSGLAQILNKPTIPTPVTNTSDLINDGENGVNPFITALDIPTFASADKMVTVGRNATGSTLYRGTIVYISGSTGNRPNFVKSIANGEVGSAGTFGVIENDIPNNTDGNCVTIGAIDNLDTRSGATHPFTSDTLVDGDTIYLSPTTAGFITNVKPSAPNHLVYIGKVVRTSPTNGTIVYRIQNGYELQELHNVAINGISNNQLLSYESSTSLWKNKSVTTADIADSTNKRYVTDANLTTIGNQSGVNTGDETNATIKSKLGITTLSGSNTGDQDLSGLVPNTRTINTKALSSDVTLTTADILDSIDNRYVSDAELITIANQSGTNTGDNAVNSLYSGLATSKQDTLVSGTNIKTINSTTLLGSGNVAVQPTLVSGTNIKTINSNTLLGSGNVAVQDTLVSGTNIKTINGNSVLGSGNLVVSGGSGIGGLQGTIKVSGITMPFNPYGGLASVAMIANRILLYPLIPAQDITISALTINVTTLLASANARILIYDNISGTYAPRNKILETTNLDCSTIGIKTFNYSYTFLKGEVYWFGVYSNLTPTVTAMSAGNMLNLRQDGIINVQQIESTYTFGTAPSTYPTTVGYNNRSTVPNIGLVIA